MQGGEGERLVVNISGFFSMRLIPSVASCPAGKPHRTSRALPQLQSLFSFAAVG